MNSVTPRLDARAQRRLATDRLFGDLHNVRDPATRQRIVAEVVTVNHSVALAVAARYRGRGIADDDLEQTACVGLIQAVRRFDPSLGNDFLSFAVPTIRGEVRRYFRDQGWMVRPPRRIQELQGRLQPAIEELAQRHQREPTQTEIVKALDIDDADLKEVTAAYGAFRPLSLDQPVHDSPDVTLVDTISETDESRRSSVEARAVLTPLLAELDEIDRLIVTWRFWGDLSQREIGDRISLTQAQVSRRLNRILARLSAAVRDGYQRPELRIRPGQGFVRGDQRFIRPDSVLMG